ncbi:PIN domain-like protein [Heliocybe sulcata]|uniref:PIN domain-like protein n=1 Tax=Heliocybe sulcata TaxID=5364 RepID=A0A5C3N9L2_9AGAM|nr:PIN domain-like protein [Heliocybe sulcata]
MGVQGLWEVLQPAGQSRSLKHLAVVDGFDKNTSGKRAFRIGIDASLWFQHSYSSQGGENPQLRLLFFRLAQLSELPLLPLFIFDGRERPKVKRGSKKGKSGSHALTDGFRRMLDQFGYEWRTALGEAEAELAYLNQIGVVDAILTDDVDAFVFGAKVVIKNWSKDLSGNRSKPALNKDGKESKHHVMIFKANDIQSNPNIGLTRGGLILFALLKGGDYDEGIAGIGEKIAHGLARCGFGDQLLSAYERRAYQSIEPFLAQWRPEMTNELRTNSRGLLPHRVMSVTIPVTFPDLAVLEAYVNPKRAMHHVQLRDMESMNLPRIARFCEDHFEWGYKAKILYRFRTVLWEACVMRVLRRAAMEVDEKEKTRRIADGGGLGRAITGPLIPPRSETVGTSTGILHRYLRNSDASASTSPSHGNSVEERRRAAFPGSARRAAAENPRTAALATPTSGPSLLVRIERTRQHVCTDRLFEYRVAIKPGPLVALAGEELTGKRPEPEDKSGKEYQVDPESEMLLWVPASILRQVHPDLVEEWEAAQREKTNKRGRRAATQEDSDEGGEDALEEDAVAPAPKRRRASRKTKANEERSRSPSTPLEWRVAQHNSQASNSAVTAPNHITAAFPSASGNSAFLFSFANPDDPDVLEVDDDVPASRSKSGGVLDRFDVMFDQLVDGLGSAIIDSLD